MSVKFFAMKLGLDERDRFAREKPLPETAGPDGGADRCVGQGLTLKEPSHGGKAST